MSGPGATVGTPAWSQAKCARLIADPPCRPAFMTYTATYDYYDIFD